MDVTSIILAFMLLNIEDIVNTTFNVLVINLFGGMNPGIFRVYIAVR